LPNGLKLHYNIRYESVTDNFVRGDESGTLWGGALTGEIVQALAAAFFRQVLLIIKAKSSLLPVSGMTKRRSKRRRNGFPAFRSSASAGSQRLTAKLRSKCDEWDCFDNGRTVQAAGASSSRQLQNRNAVAGGRGWSPHRRVVHDNFDDDWSYVALARMSDGAYRLFDLGVDHASEADARKACVAALLSDGSQSPRAAETERHVQILEDIAQNSPNEGYRLTAIR
jgi:hypothetical protein